MTARPPGPEANAEWAATHAWIRDFVGDHPYAHGLADDLAAAVSRERALRELLAEWVQYTGLRQRVRDRDEETGEYESGADLLERTDAALAAAEAGGQ